MRVEYGATRTVWLVGRYAIKFAGRWVAYPRGHLWRSVLNGMLANLQEREWWSGFTAPADLAPTPRDHLCPVLWCALGGLVLVMRRARPLSYAEWESLSQNDTTAPLVYWSEPRTAEQIRTRDGDILPGEFKQSSFGYVGDRLVVVDYGN